MLPPEIASILKRAKPKRRQHYVFQRYLKAWAADGKVWVRRRGDTKALATTTLNVAVERDFYKLHALTAEDVALLRGPMLDNAAIHVRERCELLIQNFNLVSAIKKTLDPAQPHFEQISAWLDERIINHSCPN